MLKLVVTNQKGGVAKTTTCVNLARYFADIGKRVLLVDTDPQGQVAVTLGLKTSDMTAYLGDLLISKCKPEACILNIRPNLDIIPSDRRTMLAEGTLVSAPAREMTFRYLFEDFDSVYDVVLVDTSPTITVMQTCAMVYAQQFLIPITMDMLSVHGAVAMVAQAKFMNSMYRNTNIRGIAFLPVMMDRRLGITYEAMDALIEQSKLLNMEILPPIRTDQAVVRTNSRRRGFLADVEPKSKALADYREAAARLGEILHEQLSSGVSAQAAV